MEYTDYLYEKLGEDFSDFIVKEGNLEDAVPYIFRERAGGITPLGIYRNKKMPKKGVIRFIPFGKQIIIDKLVDIIVDKKIGDEDCYVAYTLYKQRGGSYKLKIKRTEVTEGTD